jgi:type VI secretion system protein ImpE
MTAGQLFQAGKLDQAVQALGAELRDNPGDVQRRTFLFELLCFAGAYDRAEKHLDVLAQTGKDAQLGALLYAGALHAERTRAELFQKREYPQAAGEAVPLTGTLNGQPFESFLDADPRIGERLEVYAAGQYMWLPLEHIACIEMEKPKRLRDLLWSPALVRTGPGFKERELGEVLLPVLTPLSFQNADRVAGYRRRPTGARRAEDVPGGRRRVPVIGVAETRIPPAANGLRRTCPCAMIFLILFRARIRAARI